MIKETSETSQQGLCKIKKTCIVLPTSIRVASRGDSCSVELLDMHTVFFS